MSGFGNVESNNDLEISLSLPTLANLTEIEMVLSQINPASPPERAAILKFIFESVKYASLFSIGISR